MRTTTPFTSQVSLLVGIECLTIIVFVLSLLTLFAGYSIDSGHTGQAAIITFNTTSIRSTLSNVPTTRIADWYEVNYLSICSGMWKTVGGDKNQSKITCVHQKAGYTFSLAQTLGSNAARLLPADSSYGTIDTNAPRVLLTIAITLAGISLTSLLYGVVVLLITNTPPLFALRIGYLTSIPTAILLTISSAKITALADKMTGMKEIGPGVVVHAWMGWSFYLASWLSVCFMWAAVGFSIAGAFKIARAIEAQRSGSRKFG